MKVGYILELQLLAGTAQTNITGLVQLRVLLIQNLVYMVIGWNASSGTRQSQHWGDSVPC